MVQENLSFLYLHMLDGYEIKKDFNEIHGTLMKAVTKRIAIKMGVTKENTN